MELALDQEIELDEGYGVPSDDHIAVMFKALDDSHEQSLAGVTGEENLSLAQVYAGGVLSNYNAGRVAGNESLFSSIGEGLKKVWEYIKGMFKNLWGFFFSKETSKKIEEEVAEVEKESKELQVLALPAPPVKEPQKVVREVLSVAKLNGQELLVNNMSHDKFLKSLEGASEQEVQKGIGMVVDTIRKDGSDKFSRLQETADKLGKDVDTTEKQVAKLIRKFEQNKGSSQESKEQISPSELKNLKDGIEVYIKQSRMLSGDRKSVV